MTLGIEKIDQGGSFTYLSSIISKDGGSSKAVKISVAKAQSIFSELKKSIEKLENKSRNQD